MKLLLVALSLLVPVNDGSLGIGIDVLPEAFAFAARRVGFAADLRLTSCSESRCLWDLGDNVRISADHKGESLDIYRIEAALDRPSPGAIVSVARYEKACLAIIALVEHDASLVDLRVAAEALASPSENAPRQIYIDASKRAVSLYSTLGPERDDTRLLAKRCGANAV